MKNDTKVTVYYFGDIHSTLFECNTVTVKTVKGWVRGEKKQAEDIAFILEGIHEKLESANMKKYIEDNNLEHLLLSDVIK